MQYTMLINEITPKMDPTIIQTSEDLLFSIHFPLSKLNPSAQEVHYSVLLQLAQFEIEFEQS